MSSAWFVRVNGKIFGPFDDQRLKKLAAEGKIIAKTEISRSQTGPWHEARTLKGLLVPPADKTQAKSAPAITQINVPTSRDESQVEPSADRVNIPESNRAAGIGLLIAGIACLVTGLLISFLLTNIFGGRTGVVAYGAIGTGIGMLVAGLLNVVTGKNIADIQLFPDTSNSGIGAQVLGAVAKLLISLVVLVVMGWITFTFILK